MEEASSAKLVLSPLRVEVGFEEDRETGWEGRSGLSAVEETLWFPQAEEDIAFMSSLLCLAHQATSLHHIRDRRMRRGVNMLAGIATVEMEREVTV